MKTRPSLLPFTLATAIQKMCLAEDALHDRDPDSMIEVYTEETAWDHRTEFARECQAVHGFLSRKWARELDDRLIKEIWAFPDNRIAVHA